MFGTGLRLRFARPPSLADEMQQRLMLRRRAMRRRDRRHRLHTLALARHQQPGTIIPQRSLAVLVADHTRKPIDIRRKPRFTVVNPSVIHLSDFHRHAGLPFGAPPPRWASRQTVRKQSSLRIADYSLGSGDRLGQLA
jgi:hypothetical protein